MRTIFALGLSVFASGALAGNVDTALSADEILDRMEAAYASAESYADSGIVTVERVSDESSWTNRQTFATAFVRGGGFRFEFWTSIAAASFALEDESDRPRDHYVVWSDGVEVRSWWSVHSRMERHSTIEHALGGPPGVSYGSATRVPGLLMPEMNWGSLLDNLTEARLLGEETVDGTVCYKLTAKLRVNGDSRTLWIDTDSHLIRRVEWELPHVHATATIKPSLNVNVLPETFTFDPDAEMADRDG